MSSASGIFNNASAFETYLAQLTQRLAAEREARIAFLTNAINRLTPLLELAQSLENVAAVAEVNGHLAAARQELSHLQRQAV